MALTLAVSAMTLSGYKNSVPTRHPDTDNTNSSKQTQLKVKSGLAFPF